MDAQRYRKARRHLSVVLALNPEYAEAYYQMGLAIDLDPREDPKRALVAMRQAIRLKPDEALYWSGYAQLAMRIGKDLLAVRAFRKAAKLGAYDIFLLEEVVEGLCTLNRWDLAERLIIQARFRMSHSPAVKQLWDSFQFRRIAHQQRSSRRQAALAAGEAIVLKFVRNSEPSTGGEPGILRHDRFSKATPHVPYTSRIDPRRSS
jgi:Flp pilus assembly protein TadD